MAERHDAYCPTLLLYGTILRRAAGGDPMSFCVFFHYVIRESKIFDSRRAYQKCACHPITIIIIIIISKVWGVDISFLPLLMLLRLQLLANITTA